MQIDHKYIAIDTDSGDWSDSGSPASSCGDAIGFRPVAVPEGPSDSPTADSPTSGGGRSVSGNFRYCLHGDALAARVAALSPIRDIRLGLEDIEIDP